MKLLSFLVRRVAWLAVCLAAPLAWAQSATHWVATWSASPQFEEWPLVVPEPGSFRNQTIRQVMRVSLGGERLRIRFTNEYGDKPLKISAASVALSSAGASVVGSTLRPVTMGGARSFTIPAGTTRDSDPVDFLLPTLGDLVVSFHIPTEWYELSTPASTFHHLASQTAYILPGNQVMAANPSVEKTSTSWFFVSGVSVQASLRSSAIVAIGDSITDGQGSSVDANQRWPNLLAERLLGTSTHRHLSVVNAGIAGNRVLTFFVGPDTLTRFHRDALSVPGVRDVILLQGINDIGIPSWLPGIAFQHKSADQIIAGHRRLISEARARGLRIFGATLTPFAAACLPTVPLFPCSSAYYSAEGEGKRQAVNAWIRGSGEFDGVIDFDLAVRDPLRPTFLKREFDSGDGLHPSDAGYRAMAEAIDLALFPVFGADVAAPTGSQPGLPALD
jgi:lysophospholipase L1-like esterase